MSPKNRKWGQNMVRIDEVLGRKDSQGRAVDRPRKGTESDPLESQE